MTTQENKPQHNRNLALRLGLLVLDALVAEGYSLEKIKKVAPKKEGTHEMIEYMRTQADGSKLAVCESKETTVSNLIDGFKHVNPSYGMFYSRPATRKLLMTMISQYPVDTLFKLLEVLPQSNGMPYAPVITTPQEFFRLAPKLIAFIQKHQAELSKGFKIVV